MAIRAQLLFLCLFLVFASSCYARNTMFLSGEEVKVGRSLKMIGVDDYSDATANHGHDPRNKPGGGNGNGHRTHDIP
ncbi:hypothetical protein ACET3Z_007443 [Daucus carota]